MKLSRLSKRFISAILFVSVMSACACTAEPESKESASSADLTTTTSDSSAAPETTVSETSALTSEVSTSETFDTLAVEATETSEKVSETSTQASADPYSDIIDLVYDYLSSAPDDAIAGSHGGELIGFDELRAYGDPLELVKYTQIDLNGDGNSELLFVTDDGEPASPMRILAAYTFDGASSKNILTGWFRNRWNLLSDLRIYNYGSGGAAYSSWGFYKFDGNSVVPSDIYYSCPDESDPETPVYYRTQNADEVFSPASDSERLDSLDISQFESPSYYSFGDLKSLADR